MATTTFFPRGGWLEVFRAWRRASWIIGFLLVGSSFPIAVASIDDRLMAGRGGDVNFPISCGERIQPHFDAALAGVCVFYQL